MLDDIRPLVRLGVNIAVKEKMIKWKPVLHGSGGRHDYDVILDEKTGNFM